MRGALAAGAQAILSASTLSSERRLSLFLFLRIGTHSVGFLASLLQLRVLREASADAELARKQRGHSARREAVLAQVRERHRDAEPQARAEEGQRAFLFRGAVDELFALGAARGADVGESERLAALAVQYDARRGAAAV